ncbi:aconitase X [Alicyclobacillus kakegawensis]|uniref:aconitase X n=1 Tax=Alicyclobacillus kakegawensis TaxID=392012 RepID=UPI00082EEDFE|nr:aconitase X catalytic domain-containing protein [Alicyclobacillus kakegawensis]
MKLTADEQAMLDGKEGPAVQKAMELLVKYGEALGAERLVDTNNVCDANVYSPTPGLPPFDGHDHIFSQMSLDSDEILEIPKVKAFSCQLIGRMDSRHWRLQGIDQTTHDLILESESYNAAHGIQLMNTCTPYQIGNVPVKGEHCAWMESSAVVYINSVLGARSNVEGRESTAAAMLTGKIPYWGYHLESERRGTHYVTIEVPVESFMDWGLLGYFVGQAVGDKVPVIDNVKNSPNLSKLKHFGAAASTSGGVEMYHIPGVTAEARTVEEAFSGNKIYEKFRFGPEERRKVYEDLNRTGRDTNVDLVMLGCPHSSIQQIWEICNLLDGKKVHSNTQLWIFTPHPIRELADRIGYTKILEDAGAVLMSDTCPAIGRFLPKGTKVIATDSAKQVHYLPAIMHVQGWFGSTQDCISAAITGRWKGELQ